MLCTCLLVVYNIMLLLLQYSNGACGTITLKYESCTYVYKSDMYSYYNIIYILDIIIHDACVKLHFINKKH